MRLKILTSVILILVLGYSFAWHYMAGQVEDGIATWISQQKSQGLSVRYEDLEISGFPYRMELSAKTLTVIKTEQDKLPVLVNLTNITLVAFPWKINHGVILSSSGNVRIGSRIHPELTLAFGQTRSSVLVERNNQEFRRISSVLEDVTWSTAMSQNRESSEAREVKVHIIKPEPTDEANDMELPVQMKLYLEANDVRGAEILGGFFGRNADQIIIDLQLHGESLPSYSKDSLTSWGNEGGTLAVKNFEIKVGKMALELDGEVTLDQALKPLGAFSTKIRGIDHMTDLLSRHPTFQTEPGRRVLEELKRQRQPQRQPQGQKTIDLSISLQGGLLYLGAIPVYNLAPVVK